jgi:hypothetical protein
MLSHQRPALCGHIGPHAGTLRLQTQAAVALIGGRNPVKPDSQARHLPASSAGTQVDSGVVDHGVLRLGEALACTTTVFALVGTTAKGKAEPQRQLAEFRPSHTPRSTVLLAWVAVSFECVRSLLHSGSASPKVSAPIAL